MYTTEFGTARSIRVEDLLKLGNEKKTKRHNDPNLEITFTKGVYFDGTKFREATESQPITLKESEMYYTFEDKSMKLYDLLAKEAKEFNSSGAAFSDNGKFYWLADRGISLSTAYELNSAYFGIHYFTGYLIGMNIFYLSDMHGYSQVDSTAFYGVRPAVQIDQGVTFTKSDEKTDGKTTWVISK